MHLVLFFWDNQLQITAQRTADGQSRTGPCAGGLPNPCICGITHLYTSTSSPQVRFGEMLFKARLNEMFLTSTNCNLISSENVHSLLTTNIVQYRLCHPLFLLRASRYSYLGFSFKSFKIIIGSPGEKTKPVCTRLTIYLEL